MADITNRRVRINTSISVRGIVTWDATIENVGQPLEDVLAESDRLVGELKRRYPVKEVVDK